MTASPAPLVVCVYCGSRHGQSPSFTAAAREVGRLIGSRGWRLVYGGGNVGLMGEVANAALAAGAEVVGVITERLLAREVAHTGLTDLQVVRTMHERKQKMAELADVFVALPGGIGTFEELFEVWTWRHLGHHDLPVGVLNVDGFYDPLLAFLAHTQASGFIDTEQRAMLTVEADPVRLLDRLARQRAAHAPGLDDYRLT